MLLFIDVFFNVCKTNAKTSLAVNVPIGTLVFITGCPNQMTGRLSFEHLKKLRKADLPAAKNVPGLNYVPFRGIFSRITLFPFLTEKKKQNKTGVLVSVNKVFLYKNIPFPSDWLTMWTRRHLSL